MKLVISQLTPPFLHAVTTTFTEILKVQEEVTVSRNVQLKLEIKFQNPSPTFYYFPLFARNIKWSLLSNFTRQSFFQPIAFLLLCWFSGEELFAASHEEQNLTVVIAEASPLDSDRADLKLFLEGFDVSLQTSEASSNTFFKFSGKTTCCSFCIPSRCLSKTSGASYHHYLQSPPYLDFIYPFQYFW